MHIGKGDSLRAHLAWNDELFPLLPIPKLIIHVAGGIIGGCQTDRHVIVEEQDGEGARGRCKGVRR